MAITNILTYRLIFIWYKQLIEWINLLSSLQVWVGKLGVTGYQLGLQKALDEPDVAFPLKEVGKVVLHHTAQQVRNHL